MTSPLIVLVWYLAGIFVGAWAAVMRVYIEATDIIRDELANLCYILTLAALATMGAAGVLWPLEIDLAAAWGLIVVGIGGFFTGFWFFDRVVRGMLSEWGRWWR